MSRSRTMLAGALIATSLVAAVSAAPATAFPVTVRAANGKVTVQKRPTRIVVLSASLTETVYGVGAGRQVEAVDAQSNHPPRAPQTRLSTHRPNAEAVARYRPDLVITSTRSNGLLQALKRLRIPALYAPPPSTIAGAYAQTRQIGTLTGHPRAARRLVASMKRRIAAAVRSVPRGRRVSFFHELTPDLYTVTSRSFVGRVYGLFGLRNIADRAGRAPTAFPQLSAEYVISANPELIVLADAKCCGQNIRTVRRRPGWSSISAVRSGRVLAVNDDIVSRWGPRIVDFVQLVARTVRRVRA